MENLDEISLLLCSYHTINELVIAEWFDNFFETFSDVSKTKISNIKILSEFCQQKHYQFGNH